MKYIIGIALCLFVTTAGAVDRLLPNVTLADQSGATVNQATLQRTTPWVLLVVDANKPQTQSTLMRLQKDWSGGLAVVVLGNQAAFDALVAKNATLAGVRWYRDAPGTFLKTLSLPGVPAVLGVTPANQIAWRAIGLPEQVDKAQSLIGSWINPPANAPVIP